MNVRRQAKFTFEDERAAGVFVPLGWLRGSAVALPDGGFRSAYVSYFCLIIV